jgi:hypothetical protein
MSGQPRIYRPTLALHEGVPTHDIIIEDKKPWPGKKMTLRRSVALAGLWAMCMLLPPLAVLIGAAFGAISGAGTGIYNGLTETHSDLKRWWQMFEDS